jgi:uncharacterized membrane protein
MELMPILARWLHFMAGVMWIGLLYYFNFVQVAGLKAATGDGTAAGITKHIAPRALLFFRWSAVVTWVAGALLLGPNLVSAFTLLAGDDHVVQCVGVDLAEPEEDPRHGPGHR